MSKSVYQIIEMSMLYLHNALEHSYIDHISYAHLCMNTWGFFFPVGHPGDFYTETKRVCQNPLTGSARLWQKMQFPMVVMYQHICENLLIRSDGSGVTDWVSCVNVWKFVQIPLGGPGEPVDSQFQLQCILWWSEYEVKHDIKFLYVCATIFGSHWKHY